MGYLVIELVNLRRQNIAPHQIQVTLVPSLVRDEWNYSIRHIFVEQVKLAIGSVDMKLLPLQDQELQAKRTEPEHVAAALQPEIEGVLRSMSQHNVSDPRCAH